VELKEEGRFVPVPPMDECDIIIRVVFNLLKPPFLDKLEREDRSQKGGGKT
jgi:hypothetical protein